MDRISILTRFAYDANRYKQEDLERNEQEKTQEFEIIQHVDQQRQKFRDELLLILKRHEHVLSNIECAYKKTMHKLADRGTNEYDSENVMGYYCEAFLIEKERCIKIFKKHFSNKSEILHGFMKTLQNIDSSNSRYPIVNSYCKNQLKLCQKLICMCSEWHELLLHEKFNLKVKRPVYFDESDKKRNK
jgi:hypothetical protein